MRYEQVACSRALSIADGCIAAALRIGPTSGVLGRFGLHPGAVPSHNGSQGVPFGLDHLQLPARGVELRGKLFFQVAGGEWPKHHCDEDELDTEFESLLDEELALDVLLLDSDDVLDDDRLDEDREWLLLDDDSLLVEELLSVLVDELLAVLSVDCEEDVLADELLRLLVLDEDSVLVEELLLVERLLVELLDSDELELSSSIATIARSAAGITQP